jgi:hypothetical protein
MCPIPNGFQDRAISLYNSKIADKKYILRTASDTGIHFSSDKVCTVYLRATLAIIFLVLLFMT